MFKYQNLIFLPFHPPSVCGRIQTLDQRIMGQLFYHCAKKILNLFRIPRQMRRKPSLPSEEWGWWRNPFPGLKSTNFKNLQIRVGIRKTSYESLTIQLKQIGQNRPSFKFQIVCFVCHRSRIITIKQPILYQKLCPNKFYNISCQLL